MTAAQCTCANQCPGASHCICIWIYDEARCVVECSGGINVGVGPAIPEPVSLDSQVKIEVTGTELAKLGEFLGRNSDVEGLMIPATDASTKVDLSEEYTTIRAVIERTGLVIAESSPA